MPKTTLPARLLTPMLATGLMLATIAPALAQSEPDRETRAEERRSERGRKAKAEPAAVDRYPAATRKAPEAKASRAMSPKLKKLFEAYEGGELAQVQAQADEIIGDEKANDYDRAMASRLLGSKLIGEDDARAMAALQRALQYDSLANNDHYEMMLIVAQLQMQEDQYPQALETVDRLLSETGSQEPGHLALKGNLLYRMERYPEAIALLKPLADSPDAKPEWQQLLMAAYAQSDQGEEAAKLAEQIAARTPGDKRSQLNLAMTYLQIDQFDKAAAVYETLRARGELTEEREYRNLMVSYLNSEDGQLKAIEVINEGLDKGILKPEYQTYVALAQAYYFAEPSQVEPAIAAYRKAAPLAPTGETYLNLARVLSNEGRLAEAKQAAQQALDKGLNSPDEAKKILARSN
ncbi:MAG TPA: tetratricopeptide repeat protein [Luteimonas sp.]|nr:tetratricopeptide repeat protein [Luteimonas sp.]HRP72999.1 tetratricopeptide repeat protein [Luteimonas sp.]